MLRDALRSRKTHILLAVAVCYLAWEIWLTIAAPYKTAAFAGGAEKAIAQLFALSSDAHDIAARVTGHDPADLRRRRHVVRAETRRPQDVALIRMWS